MGNLLDTNIVSQRTKDAPDERVMAWLRRVHPQDLYLSAVSLAEIRFGVEEMPPGRRRDKFDIWVTSDLRRGFAGRILPVDERVAEEAGRLTCIGKKLGRTPDFADALIAATSMIYGLRLATLNTKHFEKLGIDLIEF